MKKTMLAALCILSLFATLGPAFGREPLPEARVNIRVELTGSGQGDVVLENLEDGPADVAVSPAHPVGELPRALVALPIGHIRPIAVHVPSHQISRGTFQFDEPREGFTVIHFQTRVTLAGRTVNGPMFYQVYKVTPRGLQEVSYEEAFLAARFAPIKPEDKVKPGSLDLGGGFKRNVELGRLAFHGHELENGAQIEHVNAGSALEMANKFELRHLPAVGERQRAGEPIFHPIPHPIFPRPTGDLGAERVEGFSLTPGANLAGLFSAFSNLVISGHMSTKYDDGSFHAAWGWVVTAWQNQQVGPFTFYLPLGWTYVNGDASWSIPLANAQTSSQVYVEYQPANRFVQLQDPNSNVYTWGDWWTLHGQDTDIGSRFADLSSSGDLPGIDKLYEGATDEWVKFYDNGMNALRDQPIQVTYPNSLASGHCVENTNASGQSVAAYAWSCSEWSDGKIWIIPQHADKSVVQHEIAHSINSYYWNGHLSNGAGGAHSLTGCYNGGLALTEGFADFIAYWVQFGPSLAQAEASYFNTDIEGYNGDSCSSGDINEMRVAATMWDMYDTHNDGPDANHMDGWNYIAQSAVPSLYLNNGTQQQMSDYLPFVDAGQSSWFAADRALFRLNHIIQ
jgi:hypothetical protein